MKRETELESIAKAYFEAKNTITDTLTKALGSTIQGSIDAVKTAMHAMDNAAAELVIAYSESNSNLKLPSRILFGLDVKDMPGTGRELSE